MIINTNTYGTNPPILPANNLNPFVFFKDTEPPLPKTISAIPR